MKNETKLTIFQALSFIIAVVLCFVFFSWHLIPILILFGWSNNIGITKSILKLSDDKEKTEDK